MLNDVSKEISKLEKSILIRKKLVTILKEYYYLLLCLLPVLGFLFLFFFNFNSLVRLYLIVAFVLVLLFMGRCYYLIQKFEKERRHIGIELYRMMKL